MQYTVSCRSEHWLAQVTEHVRTLGFAVVEDVLSDDLIATTRDAVYRARERLRAHVGGDVLARADWNVILLMMKDDPHFFRLLAVPEMLAVVDTLLSPSAILRFQVASVLPAQSDANRRDWKQNDFHTNFKWLSPGYRLALDLMFALDRMDARSSSIMVVPGSHQQSGDASDSALDQPCFPLTVPSGGLLVIDSGLWHKEGLNSSDRDICVVGHQFVLPFVKPYIDHVRALGTETIEELPERSRYLLGLYSQVPASLEEYYLPPEKRVYRASPQ